MMQLLNTTAAIVIMAMISAPNHVRAQNASAQNDSSWQKEFGLSERTLSPTGRNPYFVLEPGFQLVLQNEEEKLTITVLDETKNVNGVMTRIVEEREWSDDELIEVSRNFFAICVKTKDVFYFGEEVDMYKNGKVINHSGAWLAGENGAKAGLIMPGEVKVGMKYYQEIAPEAAMDRAEILNLETTLKTPAGAFSKCLKTEEGTALDPKEKETKIYAPGIGLIQDEDLLLTKHGFITKK